MPQQTFQILLLSIQTLIGLVIGLAWYVICQQNKRIEALDQCVDRRFEMLQSKHHPESIQLAALAEGYANLAMRVEALYRDGQRMHDENKELLGSVAQKIDGLLLEELRDLRQQRRRDPPAVG